MKYEQIRCMPCLWQHLMDCGEGTREGRKGVWPAATMKGLRGGSKRGGEEGGNGSLAFGCDEGIAGLLKAPGLSISWRHLREEELDCTLSHSNLDTA